MPNSSADLAELANELNSPDWDVTKALSALYKYRADHHAVSPICQAMEKLTDMDLLPCLMQICHLIVYYDMPPLEELLMDRCKLSMNFALRMFFLLQASMEDEISEHVYKTNRLWKRCELAAINAESTSPLRNRVCVENGAFTRRSHRSSSSPSIHNLTLSDSTSSLPPISVAHASPQMSLSASTSIIHRSPPFSPSPKISHPKSEADVLQEINDSSVADLMEAANVNPVLEDQELNSSTSSIARTPDVPSLASLSLESSNNPASSLHSPLSIPSLASELSMSIIQPSYASAVPPLSRVSSSTSSDQPPASSFSSSSSLSSSSSSIPTPTPTPTPTKPAIHLHHEHHPTDKVFGSNFLFKLRQLSGEGQPGKQRVYEYFYTELHMINSLFNISTALMSLSLDGLQKLKEIRGRALQLLLAQINTQLIQSEENQTGSESTLSSLTSEASDGTLTYGVEIPVVPGWVIVKIHPEDSFCLSSRNRVPYMMLIEVLSFDEDTEENSHIHNQPQHQTRLHNNEYDYQAADEEDWVVLNNEASKESETLKKGFIELWSEKEKRICENSPFSHLPGWRLAGVIVKSGDDLRQEQLASQLIFKIHSWFQAEKLPLFLRPYVVLATSSTTGLIECIPDTCSIDSLKKRIPNFGSLLNYFICSYGHRTSHKFLVAQTNFIESLAAYSIVCYLLQIKDRHNGNILLDVEGHMIHIDFGFLLSISPGNLGFELAPFKLNQEMMDLIGGVNSDMFKYFKTLLLSGLLEVRRHANELLLLVEIMATHSRMACFARGGAQVLSGLRERLALDKNEEEVFAYVDTLVYNSMRSWTTQHYDSYQYYTNGIL